MYQRKRKDDFCKKIDQMIIGQNKRSCKNSDNNHIINSNYNSNSDVVSDDTSNNNVINDDNSNIISDDNSNSSVISNDDNNNDGQVIIKRWTPNQKIEGIRKFGIIYC